MHPTGQALLNAILEAPDDDAPRLIYADWLDEQGQGERAEFIRLQIQIEREPSFKSPEACPLRRREQELWGYLPTRNGVLSQFSELLPTFAVILPSDNGNGLESLPRAVVHRGFVSHLTLSAADALTHLDTILQSHPVTTVELTTFPPADWSRANYDPLDLRTHPNGMPEYTGRNALRKLWPSIKFTLPLDSSEGSLGTWPMAQPTPHVYGVFTDR